MAHLTLSVPATPVEDWSTTKSTLCDDDVISHKPKARTWLASIRQQRILTPRHLFLTSLFVLATASVFVSITLYHLQGLGLAGLTGTTRAGQAISKASTRLLYMNAAVVLFPVCHNLLHLLRKYILRQAFAARILDAEEQILLHRHIGWSIIVFAWTHSIAQATVLAQVVRSQNLGLKSFLYLSLATLRGLTGYLALLSLTLVTVSSFENLRHRITWIFPGHRAPHMTHTLFFVLWSVHNIFLTKSWASALWPFGVLGLLAFVIEMILKEVVRRHVLRVTKIILHPNQVVEMQFSKPNSDIKMGQWVKVCFPQLSVLERDPLTLTNAAQDDYLSVHLQRGDEVAPGRHGSLISSLGLLFPHDAPVLKDGLPSYTVSEDHPKNTGPILPWVSVEGPFGSVTDNILTSNVAILVGAEEGILPFASILKSLRYHFNASLPTTQLQKVYFFWLRQDSAADEWFTSLLLALEAQNLDGCIEIHTYITNTPEQDDLVANHAGLQHGIVLDRPDWHKIFTSLQQLHSSNNIGVFHAGSQYLVDEIRAECKLFSKGCGTRFIWHGSNF